VGDNASAFGLPVGTKGVLVAGVEPNSAAAKAGLLEGDVITALNGEAVSKPADLQRKVNLAPVGQRTMLTVLRNGKTVTLTALLDEVKSENNDVADSADNVTPDTGEPAPAGIGIRVAPLNGETSRQVGANPNLRGVLITGVAQDSPAENAGLRAGDVVTRVAQTPVATPEEFRSVLKKILDSQSSDKKVALYVKRRGGDSGYVLVTLNQ